MTGHHDDPRLTAHALGELDPEEARELDALLATDEAMRQELESIRETTALLERELGADVGLWLDKAQREAIGEAVPPAPTPAPTPIAARPKRRRRLLGWSLAAAVPLMLVGAAMLTVSGSRKSEVEVAQMGAATAVNEPRDFGIIGPGKDALSARGKMAQKGEGQEVPGPGAVGPFNTESYDKLEDNPFVRVATDPRSTFSIDVDTASYSMLRRFLVQDSRLPPKGAVRIEELVNYFSYAYPEPRAGELFTVSTEVSSAPWASDHRLVRIGIKAKNLDMAARPPSNLVFLIDTSGSMDEPNKLPLLKRAFRMLVERLDSRDHVALVTYAGSSGLVLPPTSGDRQGEILGALDRLEAGGSTNGGSGIELAYAEAARSFVKGGTNRVILATDGDFNVGVTNQSDLVDLVEKKAKDGVFLSVLGFGMGNYKDSTLEKLADKGNGNYAYIDDVAEARKVMVEQGTGTLVTIAKDVKIQVELNPARVEAFRLIGYENRVLGHQDFNDDKKDAGDIGAGHTVTALYELVPAGGKVPGVGVDDLKYQAPSAPSAAAANGELMTVKLRYKLPDAETSRLVELPVRDGRTALASASPDFRFAAAVASFGMLLRASPFKGDASYASVIELAEAGIGQGRDQAARRELVELVKKAQSLDGR